MFIHYGLLQPRSVGRLPDEAAAIDMSKGDYLEGPEVPTAKRSELRYGLVGQLEDHHDGEASQT